MGGAPYVRIRGIPITPLVLIYKQLQGYTGNSTQWHTHRKSNMGPSNTKTPRKHLTHVHSHITPAMVATRKQNQSKFIAEYHARASGATQLRQIWLPIHPRNFVIHVTVRPTDRPPTCLSAPQGKQCEILHFLASVEAFNLILHIYVVDSF